MTSMYRKTENVSWRNLDTCTVKPSPVVVEPGGIGGHNDVMRLLCDTLLALHPTAELPRILLILHTQ